MASFGDESGSEYEYSDDEDYPVDEYEEMEWNANVGDNPNAAPMMSSKGGGIRMFPSEELVPEMRRRLKDVTEVLDIPASAAAVLLREHHWSKEVLLEKFYNGPEKLEEKHGVRFRCTPVKKGRASKTCAICYEDALPMLGMPCGHEFCRQCWRDFVMNALSEGPVCIRKTCPQAKCKEVMTEEEVAAAAPELLPKFESYQLRSFVESNTLTRWCPGRGCERVACASSASAMEQEGSVAHCDSCDVSFCIICGEEPHAPSSCKELAMWNEKCRNESETANWILANTKPCPKCSSRIEKNQGCNHMTCQRCKHEFCWICMGDWNNHGANTGGYYKCNKYDSNVNDNDQSDAAKARRELDRYLHYYKRYHAHSEAQAFAKKQLRETEARMVVLQESSDNARWSDVEFLKAANEQLIECRRVLKYTYTFAYYLTDETKKRQKECFEYHQEMLEKFTENLSELSEKPLAEMDRTDVVNQTRVVDRFMKNILKYVDDGMEDVVRPM
uniref:RBR-type E3 ubiquitin transferase n=1 Tax=Cyclophora tenuis TaxID=216820 RepID=A0A7S1D227_CYCTE|mmetsp:Transcript_17986/g.30633  ORF Transcript_17986/g.30633 Transcript_17986/m.30633 type:complete len:501 (+) Transcript_17986:189-1691(+)